MKKRLFSIFIIMVMLFTMIPFYMIHAASATPVEKKDSEAEKNFCGADSRPYALTATDVVGSHFSIAGDATFVGVSCPSWSDNYGYATLALYTFNKDYNTSVSADPIIKHEFVNFADNSFLGFEFAENDPLKAGEYVIEITDAYDDTGTGVGVWAQQAYEGQRFYEDGEYNADLSMRMSVKLITPVEPLYGKLTETSGGETSGEIDYIPYLDAMMRFSDDDAESYFTTDRSMFIDNLEITEEGYLSVEVGVGNDPQFYLNLPVTVDGPTRDDYPVMLIRIKPSQGAPTNGEFYFNTTEFAGPTAGGSVTVNYTDNGEWQNAIVNLKSNKNFTGSLISLRYDIVGEAKEPCNFLIDYILFFSSTEAAQAFKHEDLESMLANRPTPEPATPTPVPTKAPTKAPVATQNATAKASPTAKATEKESGLSTGEIVAIVVCAVIVIVGIVAIIVITNKKKKNGSVAADQSGDSEKDEEKKE